MALLPNFPPINQLAESTIDGQPDENALMNCVAVSLAAALQYLTGKTFDGDQIHDAVYGQDYVGAMAASAFVDYCAQQGVVLAPVTGDQAHLIAALHAAIDAGSPCLVTMPSQWAYAPSNPVDPSGWTHVGVACGDGPGWLRVMNPWGGFWQDQSDAWWQARLCFGQIWTLRKGASVQALPPNHTWQADGTVLYSPTDGSTPILIRGEVLKLWLRDPFLLGAPRGPETATSATTTQQEFYAIILGAQQRPDGTWTGAVGNTPEQLDAARAALALAQLATKAAPFDPVSASQQVADWVKTHH